MPTVEFEEPEPELDHGQVPASRLIENAFVLIKLGIQDYLTQNNDRRLSAIRNLYAGVLLLCKEKLRRFSPDDEILTMKNFMPTMSAQGIKFIAMGRQRVGQPEIIARFKQLGLVLDTAKLQRIGEIRNDIEHYHSSADNSKVNEVISHCFELIQSLSVLHFDIEPAELIGFDLWARVKNIHKDYETNKRLCQETLKDINWEHPILAQSIWAICCNFCNSELVKQLDPRNQVWRDAQFKCIICQHKNDPEKLMYSAAWQAFSSELYSARQGEREYPFIDCSECGGIYVPSENRCIFCGCSKQS